MKFIATVVLALAAGPALAAQDVKPTAASVKQLFQVMHSSNIVDNYLKQVESTMRTSVQQATAGQTPNARQQQLMEELQGKIMALVRQQLNWADVEPAMVEVYRDTFTPAEIDGMLKFYGSPAGQAVITKLPTVIQESMARMQSRVNGVTPQIMQLEREAAAQIKAAGAAPPPAPPPN